MLMSKMRSTKEGLLQLQREKKWVLVNFCGEKETGNFFVSSNYQSGRTLIGETIDVTELSTPAIF